MQQEDPMRKTECDSNEPFALRVLGDSMEPEFREGHIIIIDKDAVVSNESYVLAVLEDEYIFRQLIIDEQKSFYLKPLNDKYPTVPISGVDAVKGVIVQRSGTRRKEHKHYL
ncbi:S24 family peptidase [Candidatus Albibeggiatoa sp. nov. BB20]|uniref:S24 family peptidase n=1 Tax=Candidatus Albibeggiatoa sp. nov. BB20 TaxID=3162723 RepID=UPI00336551EB